MADWREFCIRVVLSFLPLLCAAFETKLAGGLYPGLAVANLR